MRTPMDLTLHNALVALGQLLLGSLFVYGGINHFFIAPKITPMMVARGVPFPHLTLYAGSIFQAICGACLMLGVAIAPAALGLVVFTIAASVMLANFWDKEGEAREMMKSVCLSNAAIIGGLLLAAAQTM
jgi:putative oxidoreductase